MYTTLFLQPIYNLNIFLYGVFHDMGVAIIVFSVLIRLILWPLTAKMIHSQKKMQDMQPEIAALKVKASGDKQKESQMLLELYKEKGVNPFSSCLPLLIQLPFLFAVFGVFQNLKIDTNLLYEPVKNIGFIKEIIVSNNFAPTLFGFMDLTRIPLKGGAYVPGVVLAVIMGATQYLQTKLLAPKKPDQTQKMLGQMNVIFPVILTYLSLTQFPLALTLYWTVYNIMSTIQQELILKGDLAILKKLSWRKNNKNQPKES